MAKETPRQQKIVARVMREYKHGDLESGGGRKVKNRKQAIAIGLSEAGASNEKTPKQNARALRRTVSRKRAGSRRSAGGQSKAALYAEAKRRGVPGRSRMSKDELRRAVRD